MRLKPTQPDRPQGTVRFIVLVVLVAVAGVAAWFGLRKDPVLPIDLSIQFSCDTRGRLVPCGCFTGQYGGLTRLKSALDRRTAGHLVRVDVGDAIGGPEDYDIVEYRYILRAYASMNYDALNLGPREASLPPDTLRDLAGQSKVPLISANVLDATTGEPLLSPYRVVQRGSFHIVLIGVTDPHGLDQQLHEGLRIERMETAISRILPKVKGEADLIVLLAFTDEATLKHLANEFYELDIVLGGKVRQPAQELIRENRSLILYTGNESRSFGNLRGQVAESGAFKPTRHEIVLLHDRTPEDHSIQELAAEYRREIRETPLAIDNPKRLEADTVPGVKFAATYEGTDSCLSCHPQSGEIWKDSGHAHAFATLARHDADADPNCIGCHTVGFGTPSGYRREFKAARLINVGCESCHGPGSLHVRRYRDKEPISFTFRPLGAGDCQKCHYGEFSRPFDWDRFWPHVKHGKEPVTAGHLRLRTPTASVNPTPVP